MPVDAAELMTKAKYNPYKEALKTIDKKLAERMQQHQVYRR